MNNNIKKFTLTKMSEALDEIIEKHTASMPSQVQLQLPKLKKVGKEKETSPDKEVKIKLPKLQKVAEVA